MIIGSDAKELPLDRSQQCHSYNCYRQLGQLEHLPTWPTSTRVRRRCMVAKNRAPGTILPSLPSNICLTVSRWKQLLPDVDKISSTVSRNHAAWQLERQSCSSTTCKTRGLSGTSLPGLRYISWTEDVESNRSATCRVNEQQEH